MDSRALYEQGMEAFKSSNFGSAELLFKKIIDAGDDEYMDRAWFFLARTFFNMKKYDAALFEFKSFLNKSKTDNLSTESRYWMGEAYFNISDYPNAIEEFRRFITGSRDTDLTPLAHDRIGRIYLPQKRYDEAILEWESAISKSTDQEKNALRTYWIGDAFFRNGKYDESMQKLTPLAAANTDTKINALTNLVLGRAHQMKGEHQKAIQVFNTIPAYLLKEEPFYESFYFKARSYMKVGQKSQARTHLDTFLVIGKNSDWYYNALYYLGVLIVQGQNQEEGIKILEQVRLEAKKPDLKSRAARRLGTLYIDRNPERAISYIEESLKSLKPGQKNKILILLGKIYLNIKKYDKAEDIFVQYLKDNPFDKQRDEINFLRARVLLEKGDIDAAVNIFETIRKEDPFSKFNAELNYYLALIHYKKGDTVRSIVLLKEYLKQKNADNLYDGHVLLLQIYIVKEDMDNAGRVAEIIIKEYINRKNVHIPLNEYVQALIKKGRSAQRYIAILTTRFPDSESTAELYFTIGNDHFAKGAYDAAVDNYNRYLNTGFTKNRGNVFYKKIMALFKAKRHQDLINVIKKGNFPPMNETQWREMPLIQARSYYFLKKPEEVYMTLDIRNMRDYPHEDILMYIKCALRVGDHRSAMEANEILEIDKPLFSESLYSIGDFFLKSGNTDEAELFFQRITKECHGTQYVDYAKLSLAEVLIKNKKYQEGVNLLSEVAAGANKDIMNRKNSLLIRCYFEMDLSDKALVFAEEHLAELTASIYGEEVVKHIMKYYYNKEDIQQFEKYAKLAGKYGGNEAFLQYLSGMIYFHGGNYIKSYNYFYALSKMRSHYEDEALYYLGLFNILVNRNTANALMYFTRLVDLKEANRIIQLKAMINCAILYHELNDNDKAKRFLQEILAGTERGLLFDQATNLFEEYGYTEK